MSASRSSLHPWSWTQDALWLGVWLVPSVVGHILVVGVLALLSALPSCQEKPPLLDEAIEVSLVSLPRTDRRMAQMEVRAPTPAAPVVPDAPPPEPDAAAGVTEPQVAPEPPPPVQSELQIRDPNAAAKQGEPDPEAREADRREALRRLAMQALDAPVGDAPSQASDPDGVSDDALAVSGSGPPGDPELVRFRQRVEELFYGKFVPIPTIAQQNPGITAVIKVRFDVDSGRVTSWEWVRRSGNASWDAAAERAVEAVTSVPPPPERFRAYFTRGLDVYFRDRS